MTKSKKAMMSRVAAVEELTSSGLLIQPQSSIGIRNRPRPGKDHLEQHTKGRGHDEVRHIEDGFEETLETEL
jgi:hypothetical protein